MDPDLPKLKICTTRIDQIRNNMTPVPFERKLEMCERHGLSIENVQAIFNHADTIDMFEQIVAGGREANQVYKYMYNII